MSSDPAPYRAFEPGLALEPYVERLWRLRHPGSDRLEHVFPDGCVEIVVHLGARFFDRSRSSEQPPAFVAGQLTRPMALEAAGPVLTWGAKVWPHAASALLQVPIPRLTDALLPLDQASSDLRSLPMLLERAADDEAAAEVFRATLTSILAPERIDPVVAQVSHEIISQGGTVALAALAEISGMSARQLERRFADSVGLTPKVLCRIFRFQKVLERIPEDARPSWAAIAQDAGFSDQAHLVREVRRMTGLTPTRLLRDDGRLQEHIDIALQLLTLGGTDVGD